MRKTGLLYGLIGCRKKLKIQNIELMSFTFMDLYF